MAGHQRTDWPGGQNLVRYPKGSNGGVHRGPDKACPRRHVVEVTADAAKRRWRSEWLLRELRDDGSIG